MSRLRGLGASAAAPAVTHAVQDPAPNGDNGTTIDPLQYNCGNDAPSCGQVGESDGYYNGTNVDLLYSENCYCDANVSSAATSGCEVGAGPSPAPSATSAGNSGTSLGNTTHGDTLYIPVPLFSNPPPTQCTATATCIDHPSTIDLSRIAADLPGSPSMASVSNVPIRAHDHVVGTRNGGAPEWWNVEVVATTNPATFGTLTSVSAINAAVTLRTDLRSEGRSHIPPLRPVRPESSWAVVSSSRSTGLRNRERVVRTASESVRVLAWVGRRLSV